MSEHWDAGDAGCGRLLFELRARLERVAPGGALEVVARDEGARYDLPAWCRMTGHALVSQEHPVYVIRRRED